MGGGTNHGDRKVPFLTYSETQVTWAWPENGLTDRLHERRGHRECCQGEEDQQRLAAALLVIGLSGFLLMYIHVKKREKNIY